MASKSNPILRFIPSSESPQAIKDLLIISDGIASHAFEIQFIRSCLLGDLSLPEAVLAFADSNQDVHRRRSAALKGLFIETSSGCAIPVQPKIMEVSVTCGNTYNC
jgi:hypothetical protein